MSMQTHVTKNGQHYVVSTAYDAGKRRWETLVFPANAKGRIIDDREIDHAYHYYNDQIKPGHEAMVRKFQSGSGSLSGWRAPWMG
jgi:hypothetical protein